MSIRSIEQFLADKDTLCESLLAVYDGLPVAGATDIAVAQVEATLLLAKEVHHVCSELREIFELMAVSHTDASDQEHQ